MDIREYISSGILASYAQGVLSEGEKAEVEAKLRAFPELRKELGRLEGVHVDVALNMTTRWDLMRESNVRNGNIPPTRVQTLNPEHSITFWRIATATSVCLALIASYFVVEYREQLTGLRSAHLELLAQNQQIDLEQQQLNERLDHITGTLNIVGSPAYARIVLYGTEASSGAMVVLFWNQRSGEVFINTQRLAKTDEDRQYQLWAIQNGKPVNAGVFRQSEGLQKMKDITSASAFAITTEKRGGSDQPTQSVVEFIGKTGRP